MSRAVVRWGAAAVGVATLQAIAVGVYVAVPQSRGPARSFTYDRLDGSAASDLDLEDARGRTARLSSLRRGNTLVHFWATWCAPCRTELPSLLALDGQRAGNARLHVVAVSTDERREPIDAFFGARTPASVFRGGPRASREYGVRALPETYLVDREGALRGRFRGPRDWSSDEAMPLLGRLLRGEGQQR